MEQEIGKAFSMDNARINEILYELEPQVFLLGKQSYVESGPDYLYLCGYMHGLKGESPLFTVWPLYSDGYKDGEGDRKSILNEGAE